MNKRVYKPPALTKHTASSQVKVGYGRLLQSLDLIHDARAALDRDDRKNLTRRWDELDAIYNSLLLKLHFPQFLSPTVVLKAHEFSLGAKLLLRSTLTTTSSLKRRSTMPPHLPNNDSGSATASPPKASLGSPPLSDTGFAGDERDSVFTPSLNGRTIPSEEILSENIIILPIDKRQFDRSPTDCGGFADVWLCDWIDNGKTHKVGVKVMRWSNDTVFEGYKKIIKHLFRELRIWQLLRHPNVLKFHGICNTLCPFPGIVSPWMANGHVRKYLSRRSPNVTILDRLSLLLQAASGLQYLHENDPPVVHADLKAANVLVDDQGNACLADFGLSRLLEGTLTGPSSATSTFAGSIRWIAPELLNFDVEPRAQVSRDTDIYSFGGLMMEVLSGHVPYHNTRNEAQVLFQITKGLLPRRPNCAEQQPCGLSTCATICEAHWEYMKSCWSVDAKMRPKIADVRAQLERFVNLNAQS